MTFKIYPYANLGESKGPNKLDHDGTVIKIIKKMKELNYHMVEYTEPAEPGPDFPERVLPTFMRFEPIEYTNITWTEC